MGAEQSDAFDQAKFPMACFFLFFFAFMFSINVARTYNLRIVGSSIANEDEAVDNGQMHVDLTNEDGFGDDRWYPSISQELLNVSGSSRVTDSYVKPRRIVFNGPFYPQESFDDVLNDRAALRPDPGTETDFEVENNPFAFSPGQLTKMYNPKSLVAIHALGGLGGLEKIVRTRDRAGPQSSCLDELPAKDMLPAQDQATRVFEIPGIINGGRHVNALGDYCAKLDFMHEAFAQKEDLKIDRTARTTVRIGSGKIIDTLGTTETSFRFQDEETPYVLKFHVLPSCLHDIILGKRFLRATRTFADLRNKARRVKERVLKGICQRHLFYLGSSAPTFTGHLNGIPQLALADSGAKIPIIDEKHAQRLNIKIRTRDEDKHQLVFADGSTARTSGMAYNVPWSFGSDEGESHMLDFHVLPNAPAEVILSDTFLFDNEAFSRYECYLVDEDDDEPEAFFFAIDMEENPVNVSVSAKFAELVRQGEEEDRIERLPKNEQAAARAIEKIRIEAWKAAQTAQAQSQSQSSPASTAASNSQSHNHAAPQKNKRSRIWLKLKFKPTK